MLVSHNNIQKAVDSVVKQNPDEFRVYLDVKTISDVSKVLAILDNVDVEVSEFVYPKRDHHMNIVHNYHKAILECNGEFVVKADDDDLVLGDRRKLIDSVTDDVGIIHGDKTVNYMTEKRHNGTQIKNHSDLRDKRIFSGTVTFRKQAFEQIHAILDHGYFYDWKSWYWILRAGWKAKYVNEILYYQNWQPPKQDRLRLYGTFPEVIGNLNGIPDELLEESKRMESNWQNHLSVVDL